MLVGVTGGLETAEFNRRLAEVGLDFSTYRQLIAAQAAMLHGVIGTFMPVFMAAMLPRIFGKNRSWREGLAITFDNYPDRLLCTGSRVVRPGRYLCVGYHRSAVIPVKLAVDHTESTHLICGSVRGTHQRTTFDPLEADF